MTLRAKCKFLQKHLRRAVMSCQHLSTFERARIKTLKESDCSLQDIARRVGRSASTVSRELARVLSYSTTGCVNAESGRTPHEAFIGNMLHPN